MQTARVLLCLPALIPLLAVLGSLATGSEHWPHLLTVVLPGAGGNSLILVCSVTLSAAALGTGLAWLTARFDFPLRSALHIALLLPLALPGYVLGFVAIAGLDYSGPVQTSLRSWLATPDLLWQIRGLAGAALVLSLTLYPYVYLIAGNAFRSISVEMLEAAATLGQRRIFRKVAWPLARPWVAGGSLLVAMETLADFGTVALFNVDTLTTAIYKTWFGLFDLSAALQLAGVLVLVALLLMSTHQWLQSGTDHSQNAGRPMPRIQLRGSRAWACSGGLLLFVLLVAGVPVATLLHWSIEQLQTEWDTRYFGWLGHSLQLALSSAVLIVAAALLLTYLNRSQPSRWGHALSRLANLGYALPGTLLAVGLFAPLAALENALADFVEPGWVTRSLLLVLLGYLARFLTVAHTPISQQMRRLTLSLDDASRSLGVTGWRLLHRVHRPLLTGALGSAAALIVIDVIKEMPITLMTRPFGWNTLATRVFELTAEGEFERAALPALTIVLAGLLPIALLLRSTGQSIIKEPYRAA